MSAALDTVRPGSRIESLPSDHERGTKRRAAAQPRPSTRSQSHFRTDIQALRAVAVLAVILYHARVPGITGGYVGVDVFFVISGFLITGGLIREHESGGRIRLLQFYARRARRLLPSALVVLLATIVLARMVEPVLRATSIFAEARFAATYSINYRLAQQGVDYLHASGDVSPLQHLWSLSVEEQFYLIWPIVLVLVGLSFRKHFRIAVGVALCAGLAASLYVSIGETATNPGLAYFSLQSRAWELAVGAAIALLVPGGVGEGGIGRWWVGELMKWAGLTAIVLSCVLFSDSTQFPGTAALLPVGGAALFIASRVRGHAGILSKLVTNRAVQGLGKVSYPWYLWHWPLIVLLPLVAGRPFSWIEQLEMMMIALWFAVLTNFLLELPLGRMRMRARQWIAMTLTLPLGVVATGAVLALSLPTVVGTGKAQHIVMAQTLESTAAAAVVKTAVTSSSMLRAAPKNLTPDLSLAAKDVPVSAAAGGCLATFLSIVQGPCVYGDAKSTHTMVLFGDSHADQWQPAFDQAGKTKNWKVIDWTKSACPIAQVTIVNPKLHRTYTECNAWRDQTVRKILALHPDKVVLGQSDSVTGRTFTDRRWAQTTVDTARIFQKAGIATVYMLDTVYPAGDVPECVAQHLTNVRLCGRTNYASWIATRHNVLASALTADGIITVEPHDWLCSPAFCPVIVGNILVYRDASHLTATYSRWLAPLVAPVLDGPTHS